MSTHPKPEKRAKVRKPLARTSRPRQQSKSPAAVARRKADREWAKAVKARTCGICAYAVCAQRATDAHHLWPKKAHPELRHVLTNGIGLCRQHHILAHVYMGAFREEFA